MPRAKTQATKRKVINPETGKWTGKWEEIPSDAAILHFDTANNVTADDVTQVVAAPPPLPQLAGVDAEGYALIAPPEGFVPVYAPAPEQPAETGFEEWWNPKFEGLTLRPSPNETIVWRDYRVRPKNANEDAFVRRWVEKQRRGNDPERWHGRTPGLIAPVRCGFCQADFWNQNVLADHLQAKHFREELADQRVR